MNEWFKVVARHDSRGQWFGCAGDRRRTKHDQLAADLLAPLRVKLTRASEAEKATHRAEN